MVSLSDSARAELDNYFADKQKTPIRVYLNKGGCCGPSLNMALDEARDNDDVFDLSGYTFVVDKELMAAFTLARGALAQDGAWQELLQQQRAWLKERLTTCAIPPRSCTRNSGR